MGALCSFKSTEIKKALIQAALAPIEHLDLLQNTHGMIFLGTPHRGTKYSYFARAAALLLNGLNANSDIFLPLKVNSSALFEQHASFMDRYGNLDMVNFYETRALPLFHYPIINLPFRVMVCFAMPRAYKETNPLLTDC